jgi:hypothetical protein
MSISIIEQTVKHLKLNITLEEYQAFRERYRTKSGSAYETIYGQQDQSVWENIPEYLLARCPLCGAIYTEQMDTYSIEHWTLGLTDTVYSNIRQFIGCQHFAGVTSFINLQGKTPTEITYFNFKPEVPYILPDYLPDSPRSYAVMHSLPICRVENGVFIPAYSLFLITYYSLHPDILHARAIKGHDIDGPIPRPYAFKFDWDLLPWVTAGKLQWLDLEKENLPLKSGQVDEFPYANIQGRRKYFKYRKGEFQDALWGM